MLLLSFELEWHEESKVASRVSFGCPIHMTNLMSSKKSVYALEMYGGLIPGRELGAMGSINMQTQMYTEALNLEH